MIPWPSTATPEVMLASSPLSRICHPSAALTVAGSTSRTNANTRRRIGGGVWSVADVRDNVPCWSAMLTWLLLIWRQLPSPLRHAYLRLRYGNYAVGVAALIRDTGGRILLVHRTYSYEEPWA